MDPRIIAARKCQADEIESVRRDLKFASVNLGRPRPPIRESIECIALDARPEALIQFARRDFSGATFAGVSIAGRQAAMFLRPDRLLIARPHERDRPAPRAPWPCHVLTT